MLNILHINSNYLTSRLHENLLDNIESDTVNNTVFMPIKKEKIEEFLFDTKHEVIHPVTFKDRDKYFFSWKQAKILNQLNKSIKVQNYDLVHAHTLFTDGNVAYRLFKKFNIPYVVTVRGFTDIDSFFKKRINLRHKGRKILQHAKKIIFLSNVNREKLLENYINDEKLKLDIMNKSEIIPNGIDSFWFENEMSPKKIHSEDTIKCIFVGKIMKLKNVDGIINAVNQFNQFSNQKVELTIVGEDYEKKYATKMRSKASNLIHFVGKLDRNTLIDYYRKNDIFMMVSFSETFGLVYPEAMSQGLPIIYTKGQGFDGYFENGEIGFAAEADNINSIVEGINNVILNYDQLSANALKEFKLFNWKNLSKEIVNIYSEVEL